jgi:dienelactone hydrolase
MLTKHTPVLQVVSPAAAKVVSHLKAQGVTSFGALGFCWGAAMAVQLATSSPDTYRALGFLHPTLFGNEQGLVGPVQVPLISCSAQGDPLETIQAAMEGKACASACVYRRYDTMIHGFCGARGDFSKPEVVAAVTEVLQLLSEFYSKNL